MKAELLLDEVAKKVEIWRKSKKYRGETLPKEITDNIKALAKFHKNHDIAEALKMSGSTINKVLNKNQNVHSAKKVRRAYSLEERLALVREWQHSGMKMEAFCKANNIPKSTFYQWCQRPMSAQEDHIANWLPVRAKQAKSSLDNTIAIELPLPNQGMACIKLLKSEAVGFFQELYHAIATVR